VRVSFDVFARLPRQQRSWCASFFIFFSAPKGPKSGSSLSAQIAIWTTFIARTHIRKKKKWEEKTSGHDAYTQSDVFFFFFFFFFFWWWWWWNSRPPRGHEPPEMGRSRVGMARVESGVERFARF
jgi:hypothetical protein